MAALAFSLPSRPCPRQTAGPVRADLTAFWALSRPACNPFHRLPLLPVHLAACTSPPTNVGARLRRHLHSWQHSQRHGCHCADMLCLQLCTTQETFHASSSAAFQAGCLQQRKMLSCIDDHHLCYRQPNGMVRRALGAVCTIHSSSPRRSPDALCCPAPLHCSAILNCCWQLPSERRPGVHCDSSRRSIWLPLCLLGLGWACGCCHLQSHLYPGEHQ